MIGQDSKSDPRKFGKQFENLYQRQRTIFTAIKKPYNTIKDYYHSNDLAYFSFVETVLVGFRIKIKIGELQKKHCFFLKKQSFKLLKT